jgi:hypothetical protein
MRQAITDLVGVVEGNSRIGSERLGVQGCAETVRRGEGFFFGSHRGVVLSSLRLEFPITGHDVSSSGLLGCQRRRLPRKICPTGAQRWVRETGEGKTMQGISTLFRHLALPWKYRRGFSTKPKQAKYRLRKPNNSDYIASSGRVPILLIWAIFGAVGNASCHTPAIRPFCV